MLKEISIKYVIAAVCFAFLCPAYVYASSGDGAMAFVRVTHDPERAAMGGAGVAYASSIAYSSFVNAAAIPYSEKTYDVAAGYQSWQPSMNKVQNISAAGAWNAGGKFGVALGFTYGMCGKYDVTDSAGEISGTFSPSEMQVSLGLAWRFLPYLSAGVNVKYLVDRLSRENSYGAAASDVFLMGSVSGFKAALGVSSLGSKVKSASGASFSLPSSVTLGLGYGTDLGKRHSLDIMADADCYFSGTFSAAAGASYTYNDLVSVRAGYRYGGESVIPSYASVGVGVRLFGVKIDAAYLIASGESPLRNSLTVGIGYSF